MNKIFQLIKLCVEVLFNLKLLFYKNTKKDKIVLLLTPQYVNYGDHAIALAEKNILKKIYPNYEILEINFSFMQFWPKKVRNCINDNDTLIITGGGYVGDLWPDLQKEVNQIISIYSTNPIIFAPQTIYFSSENTKELYEFKTLLKSHPNIYIWAREQNTYRFLKEKLELSDKHCGIMPDLVLFLDTSFIKKSKHSNTIGLCMRNDKEKILSDDTMSTIISKIQTSKYTWEKISMAYDHAEIPVWIRNAFVRKKLKQYANMDFIITDRLHGMIFATITGTPCIVFDNVSKKISGIYPWLKELDYIFLVNNMNEFQDAYEKIQTYNGIDCKKKFEKYQKQIQEKYIP